MAFEERLKEVREAVGGTASQAEGTAVEKGQKQPIVKLLL